MKDTFLLLAATAALATAIVLPASGSVQLLSGAGASQSAMHGDSQGANAFVLASNDDKDDEDHGKRRASRHDDDDKYDCDDDDDCYGVSKNPAPAGSTTPPQNGLFGTGSLPKVQMN